MLLLIIPAIATAQAGRKKLENVTPGDFKTQKYEIDSSAHAVVLADVGSSDYEGNKNGDFSIIFKRHTRIRLLHRNAFDAATVTIPVYGFAGVEEKIETIEATTYSMENGKLVATKLDRGSVYKDKVSKRYTLYKFTMPNLTEGCIIDIQYKLNSPYPRDLHSWSFQGEHPVLWSEYRTAVPVIYDFVVIKKGYHPFAIQESKSQSKIYSILYSPNAMQSPETINVNTYVINTVWAMKDVPALKSESHTTTMANHIARLDFQLSKLRYPEQPVQNVLNTWELASEKLMAMPNFGDEVSKTPGWLKNEARQVYADNKGGLEAAKKVFSYVQANFTCTNHDALFMVDGLKKTFQTKSGNVAEINLLLTAMLRAVGIDAHPAVLSTRDNGRAYELYPILDQLNYVVAHAAIDGQTYLLDATRPLLGFGKLHTSCYNGSARVINPAAPVMVPLIPDSLKDAHITMMSLMNDSSGWKGFYTSNLKYQESFDLRQRVGEKNMKEYFEGIKKSYLFDVNITNPDIEEIKNFEQPIRLKYELAVNNPGNDEDILYINPMFNDAVKDNPFKATKRLYPVEMDELMNKVFILTMQVPAGYKVEELPRSARVRLNEEDGMFEYLISNKNGIIELRSTLNLKRTFFEAEEYQSLRDFFAYVVKKHAEPVVLKKI